MMNEKQPTRSTRERLLRVLLGASALFFTTTLLLAGYLARHYYEIREREAALVSSEDLQRQLFRATETDHALYPHTYSDIGYVLNPFLPDATATMWAGSNSYHVNSMGLRGREIKPKRPGVTRIVLVGDSRIFGWKLSDAERLEVALQDTLERIAPDQRFEVVTVALPGWNIDAEAGFLDRHIHKLTPDYVIWSIIPNDFQETFGILPDGSPAGFYSRQIAEGPRQAKAGRWIRFLPMPAVVSRWKSAFGALQRVASRHGLSVLVLNWEFDGEWYESIADLPYPALHIPRSLLEKESWQVEEGDGHPSAFAHSNIAIALAASLAKLGAVEDPEFSAPDMHVLADFDLEAGREYSDSEIDDFYLRVGQKVPTGHWRENSNVANVYYGLHRPQYVDMAQRGVVYLRVPREMRAVKLSLSVPSEWQDQDEKNLVVVLRNRAGEFVEKKVRLTEATTQFEIELGTLAQEYPVIEIEWAFDYVRCKRPNSCWSAQLNLIRSVQ